MKIGLGIQVGNHKKASGKKAGQITVFPTALVLTYNGSAQTLITAGEGTGVMLYKLGNGEWSENLPQATNAGTYTIYYKSSENKKYKESAEYSIETSVAKVTRTISFVSVPDTLGKEDTAVIAATPSAGANDGTISYSSSNSSILSVNGNVVTAVSGGNAVLTAAISEGQNYLGASVTHNVVVVDYSTEYLTFVPIEDSTFGFYGSGLSYSLDNGQTWTALEAEETTPTVAAGNKIMWKNNTELTPDYDSGIGTFISSANFDVKGNIMSLLFGDNFANQTSLSGKDYAFCYLFAYEESKVRNAANLVLPATTLADYCYNSMFSECTSLTTAPTELPATTLAYGCYGNMFGYCTSLTTTPVLPATTLAYGCYSSMFSGCRSLTAAPSLPATTLAESCYESMFSECTSLTTAPVLPATTLAYGCYSSMFSGCRSLTAAPTLPATTLAYGCYSSMFERCTSLTTAPVLSATTLEEDCYRGMFDGCTSLTSAPVLPATTLANHCYWNMFDGCTSLASAPVLPATTLADGCYNSMFSDCTSLTSAPSLPATILANSCYRQMFSGCTSLTSAPELLATTLVALCYRDMFNGCTSLSYVKMLATNISASFCLTDWLKYVSASGTFVKADGVTIPSGTSGIPNGWTVQEV